jgi:hypothetical protein
MVGLAYLIITIHLSTPIFPEVGKKNYVDSLRTVKPKILPLNDLLAGSALQQCGADDDARPC